MRSKGKTNRKKPLTLKEVTARLICMTVKEAWEIVGGLSKPSKMPCYGFSIPAATCKTGTKLRLIPDSVCSKCYACRGHYRYPVVKIIQAKRFKNLSHYKWVEAMAILINSLESSGYFRWFDSGDIQSVAHLNKIVRVCQLTPKIKHWLPSREYSFVRAYLAHKSFPDNLTVRLSSLKIDGVRPLIAKFLGLTTSGVSKHQFNCPAPFSGGKCLQCKMCWDKNVSHVTYRAH
jgi:hypothetical protein